MNREWTIRPDDVLTLRRLRLEDDRDEDGFLSLHDELTSSTSPKATVTFSFSIIDLTEDEARWLLGALTAALSEQKDAHDAESSAHGEMT